MAPMPDWLQAVETRYATWPTRDTTEAWATLKAAEAAFSDAAAIDMRAAFMGFAAPDAGKIAGVNYVFGREAIGEGYRNPPAGFSGNSWHAEYGSVAASNDLGFNIGPVDRKNAPATGGLFFTIWRRQADGEWKYLVD
jgi:hypothetical protein